MKKVLAAVTSLALTVGIPTLAFAAMPDGLAGMHDQALVRNVTALADDVDGAANRIATVVASQPVAIQATLDEAAAQAESEATADQTSPDAGEETTVPVPSRPCYGANRGGNYVDADGNGVCDNYENGTCPNGSGVQGSCPNGYDRPQGNGGQGQANRVCDGTGQGAGAGMQGTGRGHHGGR